jgi:FAD/FMN-containing dehydrogenase/Fe-S oxidoreductase
MDFKELQSGFEGELFFNSEGTDLAVRRVYATDASEYQELPLGVAITKKSADLRKLIDYARSNKTTLIPRAAGTSLAGQVVGNGIVVDISKYFTEILELNQNEKWVRVQPGVIRDDLNAFLKPYGLQFGPETSTASRAMIGGMIGNNSCGLHSIAWGNTRDQLLEVNALLYDGSEVVFKALSRKEWEAKSQLDNAEGRIYNGIGDLLGDTENRRVIAEGFPDPDIKRRNTGYALDLMAQQFPKLEQPNLCTLIAGSEGTLCLVTEAKLRLMDLPSPHVAMVAVHAASMQEALQANLLALEHGCAASELVDDFILQFTKGHPDLSANRFFIVDEPRAILMVEFFAKDQEELTAKTAQFVHTLQVRKLGYAHPVLKGEQCKLAWDVRKAGLGLLRNLPGDARPVNLIEDCAVLPKDLPAYIDKLERLLQQHGVQYSIYAHAGAGELHVEPIINLKTAAGQQQFRSILEETVQLVKSFNGSLSGEHGDGRLRGEFIPALMGENVYALYRDLKSIFDPYRIFNSGKIVDTPPMDAMLRYKADMPSPSSDTIFNFSNEGGFLKLAEKCSGSGDCRKTEITGGTMCPSYMATRSEKDTTRARANILRQYLTKQETVPVYEEEVKEILDLCLSCKACKTECPSGVDVAKMKAEFMQSYYDKKGVPARTKLIASFGKQMQLASLFSVPYNLLVRISPVRKLLNKLIGFHPQRSLPKVASQTFKSWFEKRQRKRKGQRIGKIEGRLYIFCDEFTNFNDVEIGKKAVMLMQELGYEVRMVDHPESARAHLSKGLLKEAKELANQLVKLFSALLTEDIPLVGIEPSAILGFRDEYPALVDAALQDDAKRIAKHVFLFEEWFMREADKGIILREQFTSKPKKLKIHGHCHQKALSSMTPVKRALSFPQHYEARLIPSGCCGMAGSFGYEKEHYDISMQVGELVLFKAAREMNEDCILVASGTSCRHQIKDGTGKKSYHPAELLYDALKK